MTYAATLRRPGSPPSPLPPFAADSDDAARAIALDVASQLGASVWMLWESCDGMARRIEVTQ